ncbi:MAG: hypothetical protein HGGPFJEG_02868 [Ignavibacteria bacterium]|nr:hypothetical protein [Ignavibacteria bacterium]
MHSHLTLLPYTQAAQTKPKESASQRTRTDQMKGQATYRQEGRTANKVLPKAGVTNFYETFVLYSTLVFQINSSAEMPRLRQYQNR